MEALQDELAVPLGLVVKVTNYVLIDLRRLPTLAPSRLVHASNGPPPRSASPMITLAEGALKMTNKTLAALAVIACLVAAIAFVPLSRSTADAEPPVAFLARIINDFTNPVPVSGEVVATVDGTVNVGGTVDVSSVPSEITNKLDELVAEIKNLQNQQAGPPPANFAEVYRDDQIDEFGGEFVSPFGQEVLVSFLSISTENDRGQLRLCPGQGRCTNETARYAVGENGKEFPGVLTLSFPQPVPASAVLWRCVNEFEDCEVTITVIGTVPN